MVTAYSEQASNNAVDLRSIFSPYRKTSILVAIAFLLTVAAWGQSACAFDSNEHTRLGNTAIQVAAEEYGCNGNGPLSPERKEICRALIKVRDSSPQYGDVVAYVDDFLSPEKLIVVCTESSKDLTSATTNGFPTSWPARVDHCGANNSTFLQATHSNHTHFQAELLVSLSTYHALAMGLARNQNLEGALLVNAIGDHYLQDFFAPGHITVLRYKTTDLFSNALHDAANKRGADFHLEGSGLNRLRSEVDAIHSLENREPPKSFLSAETPNPSQSNCTIGETVVIKGDGYLARNDGCQQRALMLAANVLSIKDVLNAYENKETGSSFEPYKLQTTKHEPYTWITPGKRDIEASLPFGKYILGDPASTENDRTLPSAYDPVLGLSVAKELYNANQRIARTSWSLETVPVGTIAGGVFPNRGIAVGYYHYQGDGGVTGNGGSLRLGLVIPQIESTVSIGVRRVHHSGTSQDGWRNGYNLRYDQGFSSFVSLFISVGKDYSAQPQGQLGQGSFLSAGFMLAAPTGRIWKCISNLGACVKP